ncbi:uncharacterized protein C8A04DRAFT_15220 [Dichotomopilus funicola]|uniref:Uncharacterized protein n=1 Tax=Dichotomopilus funicola TaxID=1934379 RepID=A0AAN6UWL6_9PEZI|nr:hypothetical protein C8A04DRAFT_15220 [Dichotomopilus funicola]
MLLCLIKARKTALTVNNITSGWRGTGLWPINIQKPLRSPLLLENSNKSTNTSNPTIDNPDSGPSKTTQRSNEAPNTVVSTPHSHKEIRRLWDLLHQHGLGTTVSRLVFRKVEKALGTAQVNEVASQQAAEAYKAQVEASKPSRRRRVVPDPNDLFVKIQQVHRAQIAVGRIEDNTVEESDGQAPERTRDTIVCG